MIRILVNMWLYFNFLYYGCCQKDAQLDDLEGLDEEDFDNLRITHTRNTSTMFSLTERKSNMRKSSLANLQMPKTAIRNVKQAKMLRDKVVANRRSKDMSLKRTYSETKQNNKKKQKRNEMIK